MDQEKPTSGVSLAAMLVAVPTAIGIALLIWFLVTLAVPAKFVTTHRERRELIVAAYGGQVYVISRDLVADEPYIIAWEAPWGLKPRVWEPDWIVGRRADDWYFGGGLGVLSLVPFAPAACWLAVRWLRQCRLRRVKGFAVEKVDGLPPL